MRGGCLASSRRGQAPGRSRASVQYQPAVVVGFSDRRRAKELARQADVDEHQRAYVTALLAQIAGHATPPHLPLVVKPGERALYVMRRVGLFEPRSAGGHWIGRSTGVSIPIGDTRMRLRVGQSKGHYVHAPEEPTGIDTGDASRTSSRRHAQVGRTPFEQGR